MNDSELVGALVAFVIFIGILFSLPYLPVLALGLPYWQAFGWTWGIMALGGAISHWIKEARK